MNASPIDRLLLYIEKALWNYAAGVRREGPKKLLWRARRRHGDFVRRSILSTPTPSHHNTAWKAQGDWKAENTLKLEAVTSIEVEVVDGSDRTANSSLAPG